MTSSLPYALREHESCHQPAACVLCWVNRWGDERAELSGGDRENLRYGNCCIPARLDGAHSKTELIDTGLSTIRVHSDCHKTASQNGYALIPQLGDRVVALARTKAHAALPAANVRQPRSGTDESGARLGHYVCHNLVLPSG